MARNDLNDSEFAGPAFSHGRQDPVRQHPVPRPRLRDHRPVGQGQQRPELTGDRRHARTDPLDGAAVEGVSVRCPSVTAMAEILLFHHARGLTPGVLEFAERLRDAGHTVHTPDLYQGHTFDDLDEGIAFAKETGFATIGERGIAAADGLPDALVYAGFSLRCAQCAGARPDPPGHSRRTALPRRVPHRGVREAVARRGSAADPRDGRRRARRRRALPGAGRRGHGCRLFLYPGSGHLFADPGSVDYDADAAQLLTDRTLEFLQRVG